MMSQTEWWTECFRLVLHFSVSVFLNDVYLSLFSSSVSKYLDPLSLFIIKEPHIVMEAELSDCYTLKDGSPSLLHILFHPLSGSSCSLAAGLESLGLTDIRTLVRLMCLAAAGRAGLSTSPTAGSGHAERPRGAAKASKPISCLAYLSTAVGCLASNSPNAAKLLVQLCTQVHNVPHQPGISFISQIYSDLMFDLKDLCQERTRLNNTCLLWCRTPAS